MPKIKPIEQTNHDQKKPGPTVPLKKKFLGHGAADILSKAAGESSMLTPPGYVVIKTLASNRRFYFNERFSISTRAGFPLEKKLTPVIFVTNPENEEQITPQYVLLEQSGKWIFCVLDPEKIQVILAGFQKNFQLTANVWLEKEGFFNKMGDGWQELKSDGSLIEIQDVVQQARKTALEALLLLNPKTESKNSRAFFNTTPENSPGLISSEGSLRVIPNPALENNLQDSQSSTTRTPNS